MPKVIIAMDSFKGSASSWQIGQAVKDGVLKSLPEADVQVLAVADGGEGTIAAFSHNLAGQRITVEATSPDGRLIEADYFLSEDSDYAVVEVAQASGITQIDDTDSQLLQYSSYGTGQVIAHALDQGIKRLYIGLGGSGTNDLGLGLLAALGLKAFNDSAQEVEMIPKHFSNITRFESGGLKPELRGVDIQFLVDVSNPLCGAEGASQVFGPQKGGLDEEIAYLDREFYRLAELLSPENPDHLRLLPGGGAAGGIGAGIYAFLASDKVSMVPGIETILSLAGFKESLTDADLVMTGEGKMDQQTLYGKVPLGVLQLAKLENVPAVAIVGSHSTDLSQLYDLGFAGVFSICPGPLTLETAMKNVLPLAEQTGQTLARFYKVVSE
ncbi:glycerate kinase [Streptococcus moroccensis]|nr:glycerate kinase [Streptococcus moroccensis]